MTASEYIQLKAYARIDGALLSVLLVLFFASYIGGFTSPIYGLFSMGIAVVIPFFVARRLRKFRDEDLEGIISFLRAWAYVILVFFYAGILFAIAQCIYFAYFDNGYMLQSLTEAMNTPEATAMIAQYNMGDAMNESLHLMQSMRPIDIALNSLTFLITIGIVLGMPIAAFMQRKHIEVKNEQ